MSEKHPSLSDCLEVGPSLKNDICSILLCFRIHKFGLSTDIEKAFLHVKLDEADRNFTRFLWLSNFEDPNSDLDVYIGLRLSYLAQSVLLPCLMLPYVFISAKYHRSGQRYVPKSVCG